MIKTATSATVFQDAVGLRMSVTYSEIDETTGKIIADNIRIDRIITDRTMKNHANAVLEDAQTFVDSIEE